MSLNVAIGHLTRYMFQCERGTLVKMTREELILAALAPGGDYRFTPVQVQKLMFLIDRRIPEHVGGPHFHFEPYHYGPFDSSVYHELQKLEAKGFVTIDYSYSVRTYTLTQIGQSLGTTIINRLDPKVRTFIEQTCDFVRTNSFSSLVSAIYKAYPEMRANSVFQH